jgi:hypothetical protein
VTLAKRSRAVRISFSAWSKLVASEGLTMVSVVSDCSPEAAGGAENQADGAANQQHRHPNAPPSLAGWGNLSDQRANVRAQQFHAWPRCIRLKMAQYSMRAIRAFPLGPRPALG